MNALNRVICLLLICLFSLQPLAVIARPIEQAYPASQQQPAELKTCSQMLEEEDDDDDFFNDEEEEASQDLSNWQRFKNWLDDLRFKARIGSRVGKKYFDNWYTNKNGREILAVSLLGLGAFGGGFGLGYTMSKGKRNHNKNQQTPAGYTAKTGNQR